MRFRKYLKKTSVVALAAIISVSFFGCAANKQVESSGASVPSQSVSEQSNGYKPVKIVSGEREITFTKMPKHIACVEDVYAEELIALGLKDVIVGRGRDREGDILPEFRDAYHAIPIIDSKGTSSSSYPSFESIINLEPDLVLADHFGDKYNASFESYKEKGVDCLQKSSIYADQASVQCVYNDLTNLGKIFQVEPRAQELISQIKTRIRDTNQKIGNVKEPLKVVICDSQDGNKVFTAGTCLESQLVDLAGGVNVFAKDAKKSWITVTAEQIVDANPDVIVFNAYGTTPVEEKIKAFKSTEAFANLPAVKNNHLYTISLLDVYDSIHIGQGVETLAKQFYPEKFK